MEIKNAIISSVSLSNGDHGVLSAWLHLDFGGAGQGFGGYALYAPRNSARDYAGKFIWRCMEIGGVHEWSALKGRPIRVRGTSERIEAIGHILEDKWFNPALEFKE